MGTAQESTCPGRLMFSILMQAHLAAGRGGQVAAGQSRPRGRGGAFGSARVNFYVLCPFLMPTAKFICPISDSRRHISARQKRRMPRSQPRQWGVYSACACAGPCVHAARRMAIRPRSVAAVIRRVDGPGVRNQGALRYAGVVFLLEAGLNSSGPGQYIRKGASKRIRCAAVAAP